MRGVYSNPETYVRQLLLTLSSVHMREHVGGI